MTTVVLVHGAFHGPWCWEPVRRELDARGIASAAPELPFTGLDDDAAVVGSVLDELDGPIVLCGHSYGGTVISHAASGRDDVEHLVYLCALQVDESDDLGAYFAGTPFIATLRPHESGSFLDVEAAGKLFYHDCDAATATSSVEQLRPMSVGAGVPAEEPRPPAWRDLSSTYVVCTDDRIIPPPAQREMSRHAGTVLELATSHSPMLSRPDLVADLLERTLLDHTPSG